MAKFEGYERRIAKIEASMAENGFTSLDEAKELCLAKGINVEEIVKGVQPIAFENAVWAYTSGSDYILYKVTYQGGSSSTVKAESTPTIPINIIDNRTGVASPLTSIKRNDFIEITVNASFNEQQGAIGFNTTNWQEGGGDVTFN